jgi:hypothetical protein
MSKETAFDPSRRLDIFLRINRVNARTLSFFNSDGSDYNLAYQDFQVFIKRYPGDLVNQILLTIGAGLTILGNQILISLTAAQSLLPEGEYYWELYNFDTDQTWLNGNSNFHYGKFDGVTESGTLTIGMEDPIDIILGQTIVIGGSGGGTVQSIQAGANITIDNTDPNNPIVIGQDQTGISSGDIAVGGPTLIFNFSDYFIFIFRGQASFSSPKTISLASDSNALHFEFIFTIGSVSATLTFPVGFVGDSSDPRWDAALRKWTSDFSIGKFKVTGTFDNTNWVLDFSKAYL